MKNVLLNDYKNYLNPTPLDHCLLSNDIMDYHVVAQGKTSIPGVDDGEELELTDVRPITSFHKTRTKKNFHGKAT